jgi:3-phosphoshikimate 1-carboxyvinyltransferase
MTVELMRYFGAEVQWTEAEIRVSPGKYTARPLFVEADWSSASYWYAMAVFAEELDLRLEGFQAESWQADSVLAKMMQRFGIQSSFENNAVVLTKNGVSAPPFFEHDFLNCPDIAQTLAVVCAGKGTMGLFSGLETLSIKETDRITALKKGLSKVGVSFVKLPSHMSKRTQGKTFYQLQGKAEWQTAPRFASYGDHRMTMAFASLGMLGVVELEGEEVVEKSYPEFWSDLADLGFITKRRAINTVSTD